MATTKKSTKAKIKTQPASARKSSAAIKKPDSKTTKVARSADNSAPTKIEKAIHAKKTLVNKKVSKRGDGMQMLQLISVAVSLGLAAAAGLLMSTQAYQLVTGLLAKDELASRTTTVFAPAIHSIYDLELRWAVVGIMVLSAVLPLYYLMRRGRNEEVAMNRRLHFWRWLEIGVVTGLMVEVVALLSGIQDVATLKVMGGIIVVSSLLWWVAERQKTEGSTMRKSTSVLSIVACVLPGVIIGTYAVATYTYGMIRTQWYVYALYATLVVGFLACVMNLRASFRQLQASGVTQRNYTVISLLMRVAFAAILIVGLHK